MQSLNVSESLIIKAPPAEIFAILTDPYQHHLIDGSKSIHGIVSAPEKLQLGSEFSVRMRIIVPYVMRNTVTEYAENQLVVWRTKAPVRWRYELTETSGGTIVRETWDVSRVSPAMKRLFRLTGFHHRTRRAIRLTLLRLQAVSESAPLD